MQTPVLKAPIVQANLVSKQVSTNNERLTILKNVNIDIRKGEKIAIVGTSGAGKSTLMTLLAGLDTPTSGEITLLGNELSKLDDEARAKIRAESLGFVFQSFLLIPSLTALRNVTLPCLLRGEAENEARASELLKAVGLEKRLEHLPSQLSGGEQQRVALARAFMTQPELLFADEPTGNLDHQTADKVIELLFELNEQHGTTLILVTHDSHLAERCDRVYRMEAGELKEDV
ncbi:ABC transporter ATP-binding protein [Vibrio sp. B1FLJ16]|uniref:ABC transporter ATP-binding protein n=1 Tax=Vibrio sp. B1FLJ16 TaxID=2751178 RepID=UPI0015F72C2D|nr:ABC transporter ATP-binding protein [Vibrio sp. B1FLJ16]CAD7819508.1 ABC-type transport system involved in lysophospholipase L1 biosynthesis [Vibrio sp. B1FLJ16]CAD7820483.1 ABC-type transport system involved in lysophospholipase L1 biosynthesis [Vibrio sp. B1FLJ16]CAE6939110.1 ABC-type transport system involved in lysophospholipase L1 biosynthesis [Vibrio sp. B1FLJ16]CAE6943191.1 ABC-type transport system involved in lysophospholipase L1 biosynthesis [Vibrio sp. B1FLJ16]